MGLDASPVANPNPGKFRRMNLPNFITLIRIFLIPFFIVVFQNPSDPMRSWAAAAIFLLASLTDLLDGYLARRWQQVTKLGKFLDPVADKFLILSALIMLVDFERVEAWMAILIIGRELAVTTLRAVAASSGIVISAAEAGKYKMVIQSIAIIFLVLPKDFHGLDLHLIGIAFLWFSLFLALYSGLQYFNRFWKQIGSEGMKE